MKLHRFKRPALTSVGATSLLLVSLGAPALLGCLLPTDDEIDEGAARTITGIILSNTCGDGFDSDTYASYTMDVELLRDEYQVAWRKDDGGYYSGYINADDTWIFTYTSSVSGYSHDSWSGRADCVYRMSERVELEAMEWEELSEDPDEDDAVTEDNQLPTLMEGEMVLEIDAASGADCAESLTSAGGVFPPLPCEVIYRLEMAPPED